MLLKTVRFDSNSHYWENESGVNHLFLQITENTINDRIRYNGYIYLNQIFELLGIRWDPNDENPCIRNDGAGRRQFVVFDIWECKSDLSIEINIVDYRKGA